MSTPSPSGLGPRADPPAVPTGVHPQAWARAVRSWRASRPRTFALWVGLALLCAVQVIRVGVFMADPAVAGATAIPTSAFRFYQHHSCFSAYVIAGARALSGAQNVYDTSPLETTGCPTGSDLGESLAQSLRCSQGAARELYLEFEYEYPPPFLLLPRLGLLLSRDFFSLRTGWFVFQLLTLVAAVLGLARWVGGSVGGSAALLAPALLISLPVLLTLQIGNFQLTAFALAIAAMILFARRWPPLGGLLLAFVTTSKVYPGVLAALLLARRQWRAVLWTAGMGLAVLAASVAVFGWAPFHAFFTYQLPRLSSGEAFPWVEHHRTAEQALRFAAINQSAYGWVKKLEALGVPGMSQGTANAVSSLFGLAVLGVAGAVGWRMRSRAHAGPRHQEAMLWLALLDLGSMRSPFLPNVYAAPGTLWLLTYLIPSVGGARRWAAIAAFLLLAIVISEGRGDFPSTPLAFAIDTAQQLALWGINGWVVVSALRPRREDAAAAVLPEPAAESPASLAG